MVQIVRGVCNEFIFEIRMSHLLDYISLQYQYNLLLELRESFQRVHSF